MDSTLLDQVRHLCRDRAAYEHLKAILVQQERVHQLSHEEYYAKLMSTSLLHTRESDIQASNIFSNIIAREKALAQLADAIQRSPSLELVLQIAVQVAQKLLQVDRVAIFRRHPDGRGEFATDAIATGVKSLADMPERQLSLARHMIEFTQLEDSTQIIDSIRSSSFSAHIVSLLEQIGISSYAANKIYAGQEVWGTLVAFHGSAYYNWSESDRTSLSLVSTQVGIAISLTNLRQQSQNLTNDLQTLRIELDNLQQTVAEIAKNSTKRSIESTIETIDAQTFQNLIEDQRNDDFDGLESEISEVDQDLVDQHFNQLTSELELSKDENIDSDLNNSDLNNSLISDSFPAIVEDHNLGLSDLGMDSIELDKSKTLDLDEVGTIEAESFDFIALQQLAIALEISQPKIVDSELDELQGDDLELIDQDIKSELIKLPISEVIDSSTINFDIISPEPEFIEQELIDLPISEVIDSSTINSDVISPEPEFIEQELIDLPISEVIDSSTINSDVIISEPELIEQELIDLPISEVIDSSTINFDIISPEPEFIEQELIDLPISEVIDSSTINSDVIISEPELIEPELIEPELIEPELIEPELIEFLISELVDSEVINSDSETFEPSVELTQNYQANLELSQFEESEEELDPAIEPQFIETILAIAGNDTKANIFLLNVIDSYLEETPQLVRSMEKAIAHKDYPTLTQLLDSLRSSSDYIGALTLSYQCRQLESAVKANYVVLIYVNLSKLAIEAQRVTEALRIERSRYVA